MIEAIVVTQRRNTPFAIVQSADGRQYFCSMHEMPEDEVGRKYLKRGEKISFVAIDTKRGKGAEAASIKLLSDRKLIYQPYRETGVINSVARKGDFCYLERPSGPAIFLHIKDCKTRKPLRAGQQWNYAVAKSTRVAGRWQAIDATLITETESPAL